MIEIYTGRVGASKTYHGTLAVCRELARGRVVATNIDLRVPELISYIDRKYGVTVDASSIIDLRGTGKIPEGYKSDRKGWSHSAARRSNRADRAIDPKPGDEVEKPSFMHLFAPPGSAIIIDEAHCWFSADCKSDTPDETFFWMTQSRKQGNDIILITQDADNMDKRFKRLAGSIWMFRDMQGMGIPGIGKWPFPQFKVTQLDAVTRAVLYSKLVTKDPDVYRIYNSFAMLTSVARAPVPPVKKPRKKKRKLMKWYVVLLLGGIVYMALNGISWNPFEPYTKGNKGASTTEHLKPAAPKTEPVPMDVQRPRVRDVVVVRTGDYGSYSATSVGSVFLGAYTAVGEVVHIEPGGGSFMARDSNGMLTRAVMLFPSQVAAAKVEPHVIEVSDLGGGTFAATPPLLDSPGQKPTQDKP